MTKSTHHPDYARAKANSRKLLATLFAILVLAWLAPLSELQGIANYLPLHIFMETVSVVVASTIFCVLRSWPAGRRFLKPGTCN